MKLHFFVKLSVLFPIVAFSIENQITHIKSTDLTYTPWFTGPLLAPTPVNMKPGHPLIEPIIYIFNTYGKYDSSWHLKKGTSVYAINPVLDVQFGITDNFGIEIDVGFISNFRKTRRVTHLQDSFLFFGYQVSNDRKGSWIPDFRLLIEELFPTGNYEKLDPKNMGIDATGQGSFQTGVVLAFQKLFYLPKHFFAFHWSFSYLFFQSKTKVHGFNNYGGGLKTKGTAQPGQTCVLIISGEYSLNQNWVLAFDAEYSHQKKSQFSGRKGLNPTGGQALTTLPASTQINLAPAIEYNFSRSAGLLLGVWFTLAGKNSNAFSSLSGFYYYVF